MSPADLLLGWMASIDEAQWRRAENIESLERLVSRHPEGDARRAWAARLAIAKRSQTRDAEDRAEYANALTEITRLETKGAANAAEVNGS